MAELEPLRDQESCSTRLYERPGIELFRLECRPECVDISRVACRDDEECTACLR